MTPTPTKPEAAASMSDKADKGSPRDRYGRPIEEAFEAASKLAGSNLPPADFYQQFLNRTLSAIEAPAGAVWLRTPQGFLQIACQKDLDKVGLDNRRGGRQCHNEVLRQVFTSAPPRPLMLAPNDRLAPGAGAIETALAGPIMRQYSKAPEHGYSPDLRRELQAQAAAEHAPAIAEAIAWVEALAARYKSLGDLPIHRS